MWKIKKFISQGMGKNRQKLISIHRLWEQFLEKVLDFDEDEIHDQADLLEHATGDKLMESLNKHLDYPKICPHGQKVYINLED